MERRKKTEELSDEHIVGGSYEPVERIIELEGGRSSPANLLAARRYAERCTELGGKHVRFNEWTGRVEYLYCKTGVKRSFKTTHTLERAESSAARDMAREEDLVGEQEGENQGGAARGKRRCANGDPKTAAGDDDQMAGAARGKGGKGGEEGPGAKPGGKPTPKKPAPTKSSLQVTLAKVVCYQMSKQP